MLSYRVTVRSNRYPGEWYSYIVLATTAQRACTRAQRQAKRDSGEKHTVFRVVELSEQDGEVVR